MCHCLWIYIDIGTAGKWMFMKCLPWQGILLGVEREEEDALQAWPSGESLGISRWRGRALLHCSWSWARWVHLAPRPDGKELATRSHYRSEMLRCELPNYESPGHTCSLEAHQCYRYWKIILAANLSSEFHQGYKCRKKKSRLSLKKKKNHKTP